MTISTIRTLSDKNGVKKTDFKDAFPLVKEYGIDFINIPIISDFKLNIPLNEKTEITEKLLEAHKLALANIKAGNITKRGFAANVMTNDGYWSIGTNFNNTRNDVSSICAERSAILTSYNEALIRFSEQNLKELDFKIKYICMAQSEELSAIKDGAVPCEDCLSWFNTTRYFDDNTLIFSFENKNNILSLKADRLTDFLPYRNYNLSNSYKSKKTVKYSPLAIKAVEKYNFNSSDIINLVDLCKKLYDENSHVKVSNQNVVCSIIANGKIYSASKTDWTKRWFVEPLEFASAKAIENEGKNCKISAICYFGDNSSINSATKEEFIDGGISIKSLGRIRQKYAEYDALLVLNLKDNVLVTTIGEYLPKKFIQGYKIV